MSIGFRQVEAHRNGDCNSWTCPICDLEPETCDDCGDALVEGEGCRHEGDYCASCFTQHCRECVADLIDDMAAEARMDRDR